MTNFKLSGGPADNSPVTGPSPNIGYWVQEKARQETRNHGPFTTPEQAFTKADSVRFWIQRKWDKDVQVLYVLRITDNSRIDILYQHFPPFTPYPIPTDIDTKKAKAKSKPAPAPKPEKVKRWVNQYGHSPGYFDMGPGSPVDQPK